MLRCTHGRMQANSHIYWHIRKCVSTLRGHFKTTYTTWKPILLKANLYIRRKIITKSYTCIKHWNEIRIILTSFGTIAAIIRYIYGWLKKNRNAALQHPRQDTRLSIYRSFICLRPTIHPSIHLPTLPICQTPSIRASILLCLTVNLSYCLTSSVFPAVSICLFIVLTEYSLQHTIVV